MLPYRYRSLQYLDSIRLLTLHPSPDDQSPITCTIHHVRLSDALFKFEALSYTWGDVTQQHTIYFNSSRRSLRIGTNCHDALRRLRRKDCDRKLWIDAICINQENLVERANQVRIMDRIFQSALGVVVYLGEETPGSRILFNELAEADKVLLKGHGCRPSPDDVIIEELENLIQRPWFKRVWVLQEVHNVKDLTFMCGSSSASDEALLDCLLGYRNRLVTKHIRPFAFEVMIKRPKFHSSTQTCLWQFLYKSRDCLATDPRDKIFALRSLIIQRRTDMDYLINYFKGVEESFIETALFLLPVIGLRLLTAIRHPHNLDMPSWIPDWSQHSPLEWCFFNDFDNVTKGEFPNTNTSVTYTPFCAENGGLELHLHGMRYAQISRRSQVFLFSSLEDAKAQMKELYHHLSNLRELCSDENIRDVVGSFSQLDQDVTDALSQLDGPTLHGFLVRFYGTSLDEPGVDSAAFIFENPRFFFESLQQCRIVLLDNDHISIAPDLACNGDIVCIFQDADWPCILRQGLDGKWTLVSGDCAVFDSRLGLCYEDFSSESYHGNNLETFRIC